jgi:formamidopyrimidine-DNA glycosylase
MPELPEVETLRRQLARKIKGKAIRALIVEDPRLGFDAALEGRRVAGVGRTGKYLEISLDDGSVLKLHLRMTGRLFWREGGTDTAGTKDTRRRDRGEGGAAADRDISAHTRFRVVLEGCEILCVDPRRFATLTLETGAAEKGRREDPLEAPDPAAIHRAARNRRLPVKAFLLDQSVFPGMGNIYACEILHAAGVDPRRAAASVTEGEWEKICRETRRILALAVRCRGTSMSDWRDLHGRLGTYQDRLHVYGRKGEACLRCGETVARIALGGRGTWYCPGCQR